MMAERTTATALAIAKTTVAIVVTGLVIPACAQELEPRAYLPYPVGTNVVLVSLANSRGDVVTDPTLPVEDAQARLNTAAISYVRSLSLFGRSANVTAALPYTWGTTQGLVAGDLGRITRSGLADPRFRFTINLKGAPSMTRKEFRAFRLKTILSASLVVAPPAGQYDPARLINLGTNRWTVKPEFAYTRALTETGNWVLDAYAGVWFFTTNKEFVSGRRSQNPMLTTQFHLNYRIKRTWAAFNSTFYAGGNSSINGRPSLSRQQTLRLGGTVSVPLDGGHWLKFFYSRGAIVRVGGDFTNLGMAYLFVWM